MRGKTSYKNEHFFDCIDTEEKAYWLGFLFADGYLSQPHRMVKGKQKTEYTIEVALKAEDKDHLEKFRKAIEAEKEISISHTNFEGASRCRLGIGSKHMWTILNSYGCTPNKSLTLKFPDIKIFKDFRLIRHFIRGYIDGDGCLTYCKKGTWAQLRVLGTEHFLTNLQHCLPLEFENALFKKKGANVKELIFNCARAYYVEHYLYNNCTIYLERKYNKYLEHCRLYEESYKERLGKYGELWNENAVVNSEITKGSESPYSVAVE